MIIAVVPARGGSKRVPNKNIRLLAGRPLISYTLEAAQKSLHISQIIVSSDDPEILRISEQAGVTPLMRPADLALDATQMLPVLQHALDAVEERLQKTVEAMVLLQPTSPMRTTSHIDDCIRMFYAEAADSVVSVMTLPEHMHPRKFMKLGNKGLLEPAFPSISKDESFLVRNGPAVVVSKASIIRSGDLYGAYSVPYVMSEESSIDINTPFDFAMAQSMIEVQDGHSSNCR